LVSNEQAIGSNHIPQNKSIEVSGENEKSILILQSKRQDYIRVKTADQE
jgi:hypothetical protein